MNETIEQEKIGFREALREMVCSAEFVKNQQYVHTPWPLCIEMVSKLAEATALTGKYICTLNLEFVEVLCYDYGVAKESIWFITDCQEKANVLKHDRYKGVNVVVGDYLLVVMKGNMKFDVIVGNPPYQTKSEESDTKTQPIWDKFVKKSLEILADNRYLCFIHPSGWRSNGNIFKDAKELKKRQIEYLEIHGEDDGNKVFGAPTRYDSYVMKNCLPSLPTTIKDQNGNVAKENLADKSFIPNAQTDKVYSMLAKDGEEKCNLISD